MNFRAIWMQRKRIAFYAPLVFLVLSFFFLVITYAFQSVSVQNAQVLTRREEQALVDTEETVTTLQVSRLVSDTLFIRDSMLLFESESIARQHVRDLWLSFSEHKKVYDQIRFLDTDGYEAIRINYKNGAVTAVPADELQSKKDRTYFQASIGLDDGEVYVSRFDLNVENGEVERPFNPVIRTATPVFAPDGSREGVVVLNYSAAKLIDQLRSVASAGSGTLFLVDADGYWLYNASDNGKEWGSVLPERSGLSFAAEYPEEWADICGQSKGSLVTSNGLFTFAGILTGENLLQYTDAPLVTDTCGWYVVSFLSAATESGRLFTDGLFDSLGKVIRNNGYAYWMIAFLALVIAALMALARQENDRVRYFSSFDVMTGTYNRRAGLDKLRRLHGGEGRCPVTLCFIDVNGLKEVNDSLGHKAGDEVILSIVEAIRRHIREDDFVARLGGDEFLIVFEGLSPQACENVWARIVAELDAINASESRPYILSASHGVEPFPCGTNADTGIDDAVHRADEKMYAEKRKLKQRLRVVRGGPSSAPAEDR